MANQILSTGLPSDFLGLQFRGLTSGQFVIFGTRKLAWRKGSFDPANSHSPRVDVTEEGAREKLSESKL